MPARCSSLAGHPSGQTGPGLSTGIRRHEGSQLAPRNLRRPRIGSGRDALGAAAGQGDKEAPKRVHGIGPVGAGVIALILFVEAAAVGIPLTQSLGAAALVMAASMLVPIEPLDGASLGGAGVIGGLGLVGVAVLTTLGLQ